MKIIKSFFAKIRQQFFNWRVNREIFHKISPHLHKEADYGYPFSSKDEMADQHIHSGLDAQTKFDMIEKAAAKMPQYYADAFRYIAYRDLNERLKMYLEIAAERVQPKNCNPRLIAKRAT